MVSMGVGVYRAGTISIQNPKTFCTALCNVSKTKKKSISPSLPLSNVCQDTEISSVS